ncbi:hypothetical protein EDD55_10519 [Varunaivibrio sulfuroxidans]|uniref:Uncharacterized protein n=1 Tax=Varunaivibrio sulfuroxidans TaxID=1773489 RepID=A0A4R3JAA7_9PROT|nr:hypothetical protein EDD55_10519 [Varunaivibrio sulfuroxidans]
MHGMRGLLRSMSSERDLDFITRYSILEIETRERGLRAEWEERSAAGQWGAEP